MGHRSKEHYLRGEFAMILATRFLLTVEKVEKVEDSRLGLMCYGL